MCDVRNYWPRILADHTGLRDRLVAAYDAPGRGYHDLRHLAEVFARIDEIIEADRLTPDRDALVLAAWFHDAVYEPRADNEERSAILAERELQAVGSPKELIARAAALVRMTASHQVEEGDLEAAILSDADLAILAADEERYQEYVAGVRKEYDHVPDPDFKRGRANVLRQLVGTRELFHTDHGRRAWETRARANVQAELEKLEA